MGPFICVRIFVTSKTNSSLLSLALFSTLSNKMWSGTRFSKNKSSASFVYSFSPDKLLDINPV
jgi:hypothetical protein